MKPPPVEETWSPSRVRKYLQCPRAWWLAYRSGLEGGIAPAHWRRGNVAHAALEAAYRVAAELEHPVPLLMMDTFLPFAERALADAWIEYEMPDDPDSRDDLRERVRIVLAGQRIPHPRAILGVELELRAVVDHPLGPIPVRGLIDLALRLGPDRVHARDWKTYSRLPTPAELRADTQLRTYGFLLARRYPWARRIGVSIFSVPTNREVSTEFTRDEVEAAAIEFASVAHEALVDEVCEPRPSQWCDTCVQRVCCPIYNPDTALGPQVDAESLAAVREAVIALEGF